MAAGAEAHRQAVIAAGRGRDVLELGCGDGTLSFPEWNLSAVVASYTGVEISLVAASRAREAGGPDARVVVGDAAATGLPGATFDVTFARGVIHHLDRACAEVARLLRPGGVAPFHEPLGHNPVLNACRRATPALRSEDERPLRRADVTRARAHLAGVRTEFYGLATLAVPALRLAPDGAAGGVLRALDRALLALPGLRWAAWYALLRLERPRPGRGWGRRSERPAETYGEEVPLVVRQPREAPQAPGMLAGREQGEPVQAPPEAPGVPWGVPIGLPLPTDAVPEGRGITARGSPARPRMVSRRAPP